jgi:hypothetical protein
LAWPVCAAFVLLQAGLGCQKAPPGQAPVGQAQPPRAAGAPTGPTISADPNPVPAGAEKQAKTVITWSTGDGSPGEVYVSTNGGAEKLFVANRAKGSHEVPWIRKGEYEFRLYAGKEHKTVLASVKVTRGGP